MIYGIGTDLCEVARIAQAVERHSERFAERILGSTELEIYHRRSEKVLSRGLRFLATRFAAKEAFSKAIGLGMTMPMMWQHCEILKRSSGEPYIVLHGQLRDWCEQRKLYAHVSVSDEAAYAVAFVVAEIVQ